MRYRFDAFELDTAQFSLRANGRAIHVEPMVFDLLLCFAEHAGEVLTREAMIDKVWGGRSVSDATVAGCVKSARAALGDDGSRQAYIRTVRGRGFQFLPEVEHLPCEARLESPEPEKPAKLAVPPKIAVLPLYPLSADPALGILGDAVAQEVILELSRLHWLHVIARGSSFKFRGATVDLAEAHATLGADYFLTGTIIEQGQYCEIAVELNHAPGNTVVWAEHFRLPSADIMHLRGPLAGEIVAALEPRIQFSEALQAANIPTQDLNAWAAYHRGLLHMFRFNREDNAIAGNLFAHAVTADPNFARAHAGLSFTHFQNVFLGLVPDVKTERQLIRRTAERAMELDPLDPFVNLTMGRVEWLSGNLEAGQAWMDRGIALSPNYAMAIYNRALVGTILGDGEGSETRVTKAIALSPIDPLNYAMLATRSMTHMVRGDLAAAAKWAEQAVRAPNAHHQIFACAAVAIEMNGERDKAVNLVRMVHAMQPGYAEADFFEAFPFRDGPIRQVFETSLRQLGL